MQLAFPSKFWPIITHSIYIWKPIARIGKWDTKWHLDTPIFRNNHLLLGGKPAKNNTYNKNVLRSFQELKQIFNLASNSILFYLQLRTAICTYVESWNQSLYTHSSMNVLCKCCTNVKRFCFMFIQKNDKKTYLDPSLFGSWICNLFDLRDFDITINWQRVWNNISLSSWKYNPQLINYKLIQRLYLFPRTSFLLFMPPKSNGHIFAYGVGMSLGPILLGQCGRYSFWNNWDKHTLFATHFIVEWWYIT